MSGPTPLAERVTRALEAMERRRSRGRIEIAAGLLLGAYAGSREGGGLSGSLAGAAIVGLAAFLSVRLSLALRRRALTRLSAEDPAEVARVTERYRIAQAVGRTSRWKAFR